MSRLLAELPGVKTAPDQAPSAPTRPGLMSRRRFLTTALGTLAATGGATALTARHEAQDCRVLRVDAPLPHLPAAFAGLRVLFLSDTHHSRHVPLAYLERVVALANGLRPDLVLLGGDYVEREWDDVHFPSRAYVRPGIGVLGRLRAPLGVFAVLGNHDGWQGHVGEIRAALAENRIPELRNRGVWLERPGGGDGGRNRPPRLRLAGTEDFWTGRPDPGAALDDAREGDAVLLLQHNPDLVEEMPHDPRIGLVLSGHTHGGQVVVPGLGYAPVVSSHYGQKYLHGFCRAPGGTRVFVTRGVGTIGPPVRLGCPPEVVLLTLRPAA